MYENRSAVVTKRRIKREFTYQSLLMLTLEITYPEIYLAHNPPVQFRLNQYYRGIAEEFYLYASEDLLSDARKEYHDSLQNEFPFRPFDAVMHYTVTLNENCVLSLYFDRYEFTGGAHGSTIRFSNTRNLTRGNTLLMRDLFLPQQDYRRLVLEQILLLADKEMAENPNIYFSNYRELIVKNFNSESLYLTQTGLCVYYQQYEIAPYSSGIVVFEIPYALLGLSQPSCRQ